MKYLGTYTISPCNKDIEVDCYGTFNPSQRETLEQEGIPAYNELESVKHGDIEISDYISYDDFNKLQTLVNSKI